MIFCVVISRISAKTVAGKLIMSHTEEEPYFFTFGKSEVVKSLHTLFVFYNDIIVEQLALVISWSFLVRRIFQL